MLCVLKEVQKKRTKSQKIFRNSLYKSKDPSLDPTGFGHGT